MSSSERTRQQVLILYLATPALDSEVCGWTMYDGTGLTRPTTGDNDVPPYGTGLAALTDGWRLVQISPVQPPVPGNEYDVSTLRHEFVFERFVEMQRFAHVLPRSRHRIGAFSIDVRPEPPDVTGDLLDLAMFLGAIARPGWLAEGKPPGNTYWARVWAARALRYVWSDRAAAAVVHALRDDAWRVREMAARDVADRQLGEGAEELAVRTTDEVARVRAAALRALGVVGEGEHIDTVTAPVKDPDQFAAIAANVALDRLCHRLDRPVRADFR